MKYGRYLKDAGLLLFSDYSLITFEKGNGDEVFVESNRHSIKVVYGPTTLKSELSNIFFKLIGEDGVIDLEGDYKLPNLLTINGIFYYRTQPTDLVFSHFLFEEKDETRGNVGTRELGVILDEETGVLVCSDLSVTWEDYVSGINDSSFLFIDPDSEEPENGVTNIYYQHFGNEELEIYTTDKIPYGNTVSFVVDEVICVSSFIKALKAKYENIDFYNSPALRSRDKSEHIFYSTRLGQVRGRFNSNLIIHPEFGKYYQTTIPLDFEYQSADIAKTKNKRLECITSGFISELEEFSFTLELPSPYEEMDSIDFTFAVQWDRDSVSEVSSNPIGDGKNSFKASNFKFTCELVVIFYEKKIVYPKIDEVITNISGGYS